MLHSRFWIHIFVFFWIHIFLFFCKKRDCFEFTLHHVLSKLSKKSILPVEIQFCVIFFTKNKVVPLVFFPLSDFDPNSLYDIQVRFMQFLSIGFIVYSYFQKMPMLSKKPNKWYKFKDHIFFPQVCRFKDHIFFHKFVGKLSNLLTVFPIYLWLVNKIWVFKNTWLNRSFWLKSRKRLSSIGVLWHNLGRGCHPNNWG